jgi:outer membrane protein TolC
MESVERQYALGAASYVEVLIAQQQAQNTRIDLVAAQAARLSDTVAPYQAMGGGISLEVPAGPIVSSASDSMKRDRAGSATRRVE